MKRPKPRTRTAAAGPMARRIGAGAALAILLFGVPLALAVFIGWPGPSRPPSLDEARQWLAAPITDRAIIDALAIVLWYLWGQFVRCLIAEARAARTGATARRLRGTAGTQRVAAAIITTLTMGVIVTTVVAPAAIGLTPLEPTAAAHTATQISGTATPAAIGTEQDRKNEPNPTRTESTAYITIRIGSAVYRHPITAGDDLSTIAEQWLGNADRWPEIHALNRTAVTPVKAGAGAAQPAAITPGSTIVLPRDARPPTSARLAQTVDDSAPGQSAAPAKPVYTVARGDWVYHIAARFLGDGDRYPEIVRLNNNLERADRRFPDHIEPDQRLTLPPDARDRGPQAHANGSATSIAPPRPARPKAEPPPTQPPPTAQPSPEATEPDPVAPPSPSANQTGSSQDSDEASGALDTILPTTAVLACAGMLAALVLHQLRAARRRQRQQRRPNRRIPSPTDPTIETTVRASAQPADVDRLNHALRNLAVGLHDHTPADLPDVAAVSISAGDLDLILTHPNPHPPSPFVTDQSGRTWSLPRTIPLAEDDQTLAPLPLLATVASSPDGHHLLIDLERAHLLTISGDRQRANDLLRYLAAELATSHWSDDTQIVLAGFDPDDARHLAALGGDRVTTATSTAEAIARVQRRAAATITAMTDSGIHTALEGRIADLMADALMPHVLLIADANGHEDELRALDQRLAQAGRCAVAVVAITDTETTWPLTTASDGQLAINWLNKHSRLATRLPADQLARMAALIRSARPSQPDADPPADEPTPPAPENEPWTQGTDAHGHLIEVQPRRLDNRPDPDGKPTHDDAHPAADPPEGEGSPAMRQPTAPPSQPATTPQARTTLSPRHLSHARRAPDDPELDRDLDAWHQPDPHRPRVAILGPVHVNAAGEQPDERLRFYSEIVVYLAQRGQRGATGDKIDDNLWAEQQINPRTRRVALSKVRRWLGEDADGQQWLPLNLGNDRLYRLRPGILMDWQLFRRLRARGEAHGPDGATDLRRALELVRGKPLDGATSGYPAGQRIPYAWLPRSDIQPYNLASAIVDTAHELAELRLASGDTTGARWATERAWTADPARADDHPWIDAMRIAHTEGRTAELRALLTDLIRTRGIEVPEDLPRQTFAIVRELFGDMLNAA